MLRSISIPREALWAFGSWAIVLLITAALGEVYLRSSTPAAVALAFTERNAAVQGMVGGAVHAQLNWIGSIHYEGDASWATFRMEVSGARANATMDVDVAATSWAMERREWTTGYGFRPDRSSSPDGEPNGSGPR